MVNGALGVNGMNVVRYVVKEYKHVLGTVVIRRRVMEGPLAMDHREKGERATRLKNVKVSCCLLTFFLHFLAPE